jgi:YD repeat-containing protein
MDSEAYYATVAEDTTPFFDDRPDYLMEPQSHVQYTYDAVGNRLSMTNDTETVRYTYNAANQLLQAGDAENTYNANGSLILRTDSEGEAEYRYDGANRLTEVHFADETCEVRL